VITPDRLGTAPRSPGREPLIGTVVRLDRTVADEAPAIFAALDDERVYAQAFRSGARPTAPGGVARWIAEAEAAGRAMYTVRLSQDSPLGAAGTVVGTSSIGDVDLTNAGAHLGWTAYSPAVWGSAVNPECKLLMLSCAFETCGFERVKIQTDIINDRSQAAIARLGAVREGVLRHHRRRADGSWRDTVVFSILAAAWPAVKARLQARVDSWRATTAH
jgi:RimJ/RimL family protein N-acetyltransferase